MRIIFLFFMGCFLLLSSCKDDKGLELVEETQEQIDARTISPKDIKAIRFIDYGLSQDSKKAVTDWQKYQELMVQTDLLKRGDFNFFNGERLLLNTFLLELRTEMPKSLQTNEITARIIALDTKAQKLNSLLTLNNIPKVQRIKAIQEFLVAFSNLNLQINKKFEFEKNNVVKPQL